MRHFCIVLIIFWMPAFCAANERGIPLSEAFNKSSIIAVVVKIGGRVNCTSFAEMPLEESCFGEFISKDVQKFNEKELKEELLVIKVLRGNLNPKDILKVDYMDIGDYRGLRFGVPYLIFFHKKIKKLYYEPCDVVEYKRISQELDRSPDVDAFIDKISDMPVFNCPTLEVHVP